MPWGYAPPPATTICPKRCRHLAALSGFQNKRLPGIHSTQNNSHLLKCDFWPFLVALPLRPPPWLRLIRENLGTRPLNHCKHIPCSLLNNLRSAVSAYGNRSEQHRAIKHWKPQAWGHRGSSLLRAFLRHKLPDPKCSLPLGVNV